MNKPSPKRSEFVSFEEIFCKGDTLSWTFTANNWKKKVKSIIKYRVYILGKMEL